MFLFFIPLLIIVIVMLGLFPFSLYYFLFIVSHGENQCYEWTFTFYDILQSLGIGFSPCTWNIVACHSFSPNKITFIYFSWSFQPWQWHLIEYTFIPFSNSLKMNDKGTFLSMLLSLFCSCKTMKEERGTLLTQKVVAIHFISLEHGTWLSLCLMIEFYLAFES